MKIHSLQVPALGIAAILTFTGVIAAHAYQGAAPHHGHGGHRPRAATPTPDPVPFPFISKAAGFTILRASKTEFNEMGSFMTEASPVDITVFKKPQPVVQLEYGYKKGGIATLYETAKAPGVEAKDVFPVLLKLGVFRDHQYIKSWKLEFVEDKTLLVALATTDPSVRPAALGGLYR